MLRLDQPLSPLPGGALLGSDHLDPQLAWVIPADLAVPVVGGAPAFTFFRQAGAYGAGGNLVVTLQPATPDAGAAAGGRTLRLVPLRSLVARLRITEESGERVLPWTAARVAASGEVVLAASFSPRDMDALSPALDATPSPIVVDGVFTYAGLLAGLPLVATVKLAALADRLRAALPAGPVPAGAFLATGVSLLALDASLFTTTPTDDRPSPPAPSSVLTEIMARLLTTLGVAAPGASPDASGTMTASTGTMAASVDVDLSSPRTEVRTGALAWSLGDFLGGLDAAARARALPSLTNPDVLDRIDVQVMTSAPFDPSFLARVDVGLRYHDVSGKLEQPAVSLTDAGRAQSIAVVRNVLAPLSLERRVTAVVSPGGAARVVNLPYAPTGPVIDLDGDALGLRFVVAACDADVFAVAGAIAIAFRAAADASAPSLAEVTLDATTPTATVVVPTATPGQPLWASVRALPPAGTPGAPGAGIVVADRAVGDRIDIAAADVVPQSPVDVTIARAAGVTTDRYPTLTVTVRSPGNPDGFVKVGAAPRVLKLYAAGPFASPSFQYRVDWIDTTQGFDPIAGALHAASTTSLVVDPQSEPRS